MLFIFNLLCLILNGSSSTDLNTKYQQQQTNNLNKILKVLTVFKLSINHFEKSQCTYNFFKTGVKNYVFNLIKLLFAVFVLMVAP